jgi:hypothetical protein
MVHDDLPNPALGYVGCAGCENAHERKAQHTYKQGELLPERLMSQSHHILQAY